MGPSLPGVSDKGSSHFVGPSLPQSAVYFCCTGLGVASTGRYPAPCPVKPGLSSPAAFRHLQPRSPVRLIRNCNIPDLVCKDRSVLLKYYDYKWQEFFGLSTYYTRKPQDVVVLLCNMTGILNKNSRFLCLKRRKNLILLDLFLISEYNGNTDVTIM